VPRIWRSRPACVARPQAAGHAPTPVTTPTYDHGRRPTITSRLKAAWARFTGRRKNAQAGKSEEAAAETEHKGFRIRATPYAVAGGWQTAGVIEKASASGMREHRFVRAETHPSREDAAAFTIAKARQIIDEQGERVFEPR
jgi:hypothetical protein